MTIPISLPAWQSLQAHFEQLQNFHLRELFAADPGRHNRFSVEFDGLLLDYSKNRINSTTMSLLQQLAREAGLKQAIADMFAGKPINETEKRPVLHVALRNRSNRPILVDGQDVMPAVNAVLAKMADFANQLRSGDWRGFTGKPIRNVINIGIGGSDLGPQMACEALKHYADERLTVKFVSNVDGFHLCDTVRGLNPEETLFIIASKTFTTQETMTNANSAKSWLLSALGNQAAIAHHFVAVSTNTALVRNFGIDPQFMFEFWDWVGGRYSMCSAIGLPIMVAVGPERFTEFLSGFHQMDEHFRTAPWEQNLPVILALLGVWHNNFFACQTQAILPYEQSMHRFAAHLQQVDMESNGKSTSKNGQPVTWQTGPIIWGEPGTNSQHSFFQLLHQGSKLIPADFIGFCQSNTPLGDHQQKLLANLIAQTKALAFGRTMAEVQAAEPNLKPEMAAQKTFTGNRPSNTIMAKKLTPETLGKLMAMYEHKIFVQGVIWNVFSFDQWGVELGKVLAQGVLKQLQANDENLAETAAEDSSTAALIKRCRQLNAQR